MKEELKAIVEEFNNKNKEYGFDENLNIFFEEKKIIFTGEVDYESGERYIRKLDKIIQKQNKEWYFDAECSGRWVAYIG